MRLIDLDQHITVPITDDYGEYTVEITVGEFFKQFLPGEQLQVVDAIQIGWLIDRANDPERAPLYRRYAQMLYEEWQKEQEAQDG